MNKRKIICELCKEKIKRETGYSKFIEYKIKDTSGIEMFDDKLTIHYNVDNITTLLNHYIEKHYKEIPPGELKCDDDVEIIRNFRLLLENLFYSDFIENEENELNYKIYNYIKYLTYLICFYLIESNNEKELFYNFFMHEESPFIYNEKIPLRYENPLKYIKLICHKSGQYFFDISCGDTKTIIDFIKLLDELIFIKYKNSPK